MDIQWEKVSDGAMKFICEKPISNREVHYESAEEATVSPIANKIFGFPWTQSITVGKETIVVEKQEWVEWEVLASPLANLIKEHISSQLSSSGEHQLEENPESSPSDPFADLSGDFSPSGDLSSPEAQKIKQLIETKINPAVADHGGFVSLVDYKNETVYVELGGGCQGCAMSQATLKEGIATSIMDAFPHIKQVVDVTDHSSGDNPFY